MFDVKDAQGRLMIQLADDHTIYVDVGTLTVSIARTGDGVEVEVFDNVVRPLDIFRESVFVPFVESPERVALKGCEVLELMEIDSS